MYIIFPGIKYFKIYCITFHNNYAIGMCNKYICVCYIVNSCGNNIHQNSIKSLQHFFSEEILSSTY